MLISLLRKRIVVMIACLSVCTCVFVSLCGCAAQETDAYYANWNHYGSDTEMTTFPVMLSEIDVTQDHEVSVIGTISEVCTSKGCWMTIKDGDREVRVSFKDYGFFVPMNAAGRNVILIGWGQKTVLEVELAQHFAEDAGKSAEEIAAITEPADVYEIIATSVYIDGEGLDAPFSPEN